MFAGMLLRTLIQLFYFVLLARTLGSGAYGNFVSIVAFSSIFAPFASLGFGNLLVRDVAIDRNNFPFAWGRALLVTFISSVIISIIVSFAASRLFTSDAHWFFLAAVIFSEIMFVRFIDISSQAFQSFRLSKISALLQIVPSAMRLIAVICYVAFFQKGGIEVWFGLFFWASLLSCIFCLCIVRLKLGRSALRFDNLVDEFKSGLTFSFSLSSQNIYNDIDKTLLAKMSSYQEVGAYGAAYRIMDVAFTPIKSIFFASYSRFFEAGKNGLVSSLKLAKSIAPAVLGIGLVVVVAILTASSYLPRIFGDSFSGSPYLLRVLALVIIFRTVNYLLADAMTGAGFQGRRSIIQLSACIINILLNLMWIPSKGAGGAALASVLTELYLVLAFSTTIFLITSSDRQKQ